MLLVKLAAGIKKKKKKIILLCATEPFKRHVNWKCKSKSDEKESKKVLKCIRLLKLFKHVQYVQFGSSSVK